FDDVEEACGSPRVQEWRRALREGADRGRLAREVLIEVLAYQFASPVRWIQTQEYLFDGLRSVESYVEVGAAHQPTLANMAKATLAGADLAGPRVLHSELDRATLAGPLDVEEDPAPAAAPTPESAPAAPEAPSVAVVSATAGAASA